MSILVAYASKHGATRQLAERIGETLRAAGWDAGGAAGRGGRRPGGLRRLRDRERRLPRVLAQGGHRLRARNRAVLANRPVWLFSSGPLGTATTDAQGRDLREAAARRSWPSSPMPSRRGTTACSSGPWTAPGSGSPSGLLRMLPAGRALLLEGDFRDWADVKTWARGIAQDLAPVPAGGR